jgi:hypothetical protein
MAEPVIYEFKKTGWQLRASFRTYALAERVTKGSCFANWVTAEDTRALSVGASSRDLRLEQTVV